MTFRAPFLLAAVLLTAFCASAQNFDTGGNTSLKGDYFIREILIAGQNSDGTIASASSALGIATFDGAGNYSFIGQGTSGTAGAVTSQSFTGVYQAAPNGLLNVQSFLDENQYCFGGVSALGPSGFVASATEGTSVDILIGIPAGSNVSAAALNGAYTSGYIDFSNINVSNVRQASFTLNPGGNGNIGTVAVSGNAVNLGGGAMSQSVSNVAYTLSGEGTGTINFGSVTTSQLISGSKTLYVSADGNIIMAASPGGYDLMVGIRAVSGAATNATVSGLAYVAAIEDFVSDSCTTGIHCIDAFYGSLNATGTGTSIAHNRFQSFTQFPYDYTYDTEYTVAANGTYSDGAVYQYTAAANGNAFVATGLNGLYSLHVGFGAPKFSGTGVYLNPAGIVNSASFAPITNPVAPGEIVTLFGSGLAGSTASAPSVPLTTVLGGVQVKVNGIAAPLFYVSSTQISVLVPQAVTPLNQVYYATFQVINNNVASNAVTVYTSYTSPGVFSAGGNGVGPLLAQHSSDFSLISTAHPAAPNETIVLYANGLGSVSPAVNDGAPAPSNPPSAITDMDFVDFSGALGTVAFAGLTPGLSGLYQMNVQIPPQSSSSYVDVSTTDGYTSEVTISISGSGSARPAATAGLSPHQRSPLAATAAAPKSGQKARSVRGGPVGPRARQQR